VPPSLRLRKPLQRAVRLGHPWIYRDALVPPKHAPPPGTVVDLLDERGAFIARGFFDADGPIAIRILTREDEPVGPALLAARAASAAGLRAAILARLDTDAVRLLHGEGDLLPGLVLDAYAGVGVVRFDGHGARAFYRPHVETIADALRGFPLGPIHLRGEETLRGPLPDEIVIREGAARYEVDVVRGQKTGFFLDQRENRALVAMHAAGASVLNLFGYTGGFSIAAALAGAHDTTTVDSARPALAAARRNLRRNRLDEGHRLVAADVRELLATARRTWDLVVCDPPSFAPSAKALPAALAAYRELNRAAASVVAPGGLLATASCSSHVTPAAFQAIVAEALALAGISGRILAVRGAGPDHPVPPAFPEGRYLKFLLVATST